MILCQIVANVGVVGRKISLKEFENPTSDLVFGFSWYITLIISKVSGEYGRETILLATSSINNPNLSKVMYKSI